MENGTPHCTPTTELKKPNKTVLILSGLEHAWYPNCSAQCFGEESVGASQPLVTVRHFRGSRCHCATHREGINQIHSASALPYDVRACKSFYSLGQRIFSLAPSSPWELKVRVSLQTSATPGEQLTYPKTNITTQDRRNCLALSSFTYFFKHILTKMKQVSLYPDLRHTWLIIPYRELRNRIREQCFLPTETIRGYSVTIIHPDCNS